jgi:superfamily II DNA or RNA helicase
MEKMMDYQEFLISKATVDIPTGLETPPPLNDNLFDFQSDIVSWACKRGRAALFAGTGMGKSLMELSWANALYEATGERTIIFTPLAVASQMKREAIKFGIDCDHVSSGDESNKPIVITNYQKLDHFDMSKFKGVVLDESSILKNQSGHYRTKLIEICQSIPYRLAATATPSPNDYMELGNHSQFCGIMSYTDMLSTFFVHDAAKTQDWRLKGHAEDKFWEWMASWSVMLQNPSDLGYDGSKYILPKLHQIQHTVGAKYESNIETGLLFPMEAQSMSERLKARRATVDDRCQKAAEIVAEKPNDVWVIWCNLNDESQMLADIIPGAVQIVGSMPEEKKEQILEDFAVGNIRVLISKPSLTGFGMNWQHCHNTCFVGLNDSFEQIYQAIRRFYRFGQKNEVYAHFIASELEGAVVANIKRKELQAQHMMDQMVKHMADLNAVNIRGAKRDTLSYVPTQKMEMPSWI